MKHSHYRIYLKSNYQNNLCKEVAVMCCNFNAEPQTLPIERLNVLIERMIEPDYSTLHFDLNTHTIVIDTKDSKGNWNTGLILQQVELLDANPIEEPELFENDN